MVSCGQLEWEKKTFQFYLANQRASRLCSGEPHEGIYTNRVLVTGPEDTCLIVLSCSEIRLARTACIRNAEEKRCPDGRLEAFISLAR